MKLNEKHALLGFIGCAMVSLALGAVRPGPEGPWRTQTCVHFYLEGQDVGPKHEIDDGKALQEDRYDVYWRKGEVKGYDLYRGPDLQRYAPVYAITPEGFKVRGMIYYAPRQQYYLADFELPVRPGWSGTPVFEWYSGKIIGLVSGVSYRLGPVGNVDSMVIVGRIPPTFPEEPHEEDPKAVEGSPGRDQKDQGGGK